RVVRVHTTGDGIARVRRAYVVVVAIGRGSRRAGAGRTGVADRARAAVAARNGVEIHAVTRTVALDAVVRVPAAAARVAANAVDAGAAGRAHGVPVARTAGAELWDARIRVQVTERARRRAVGVDAA